MGRRKKDDMFAINLGKRIEALHKGKQKELAKILGVKPNTVWSWIEGVKIPTMENLINLSQHFNVSLDWLVKGENSKLPLNAEILRYAFDLNSESLKVREQAMDIYYKALSSKGEKSEPPAIQKKKQKSA